MANRVEWKSEIDGKTYDFVYEKIKKKKFMTNHALTVKDPLTEANFSTDVNVVRLWGSMFGVNNQAFTFDGKEARFLVKSGRPDVIVNDVPLRGVQKSWHKTANVILFIVFLWRFLRSAFFTYMVAGTGDPEVFILSLTSTSIYFTLAMGTFVNLVYKKIQSRIAQLLIILFMLTLSVITVLFLLLSLPWIL
jgi:YHS domain-containing protein